MANGCSEEADQVTVNHDRCFIRCALCCVCQLFSSFTFAGDMFVPVEDAHPLENLLLHEAQVSHQRMTVSLPPCVGLCSSAAIFCDLRTVQPHATASATASSPPISPLMAAVGIGASSNVPSEWICPLCNKIMSDPVTGAFSSCCGRVLFHRCPLPPLPPPPPPPLSLDRHHLMFDFSI
jgi:hypothetical protein